MTTVRKTLLLLFLMPVVACLLVVAAYETDVLAAGSEAVGGVAEAYWTGAMEVITICLIPVAMRLLRFDFAKRAIAADPAKGLVRWGAVRLCMLAVPMMANTLLYYHFMNVAFGYMGIIGLLCMAFVYPSAARCEQEMNANR